MDGGHGLIAGSSCIPVQCHHVHPGPPAPRASLCHFSVGRLYAVLLLLFRPSRSGTYFAHVCFLLSPLLPIVGVVDDAVRVTLGLR